MELKCFCWTGSMANGGFGVWFECGPPLTKPGSKAVGSDTKLEGCREAWNFEMREKVSLW